MLTRHGTPVADSVLTEVRKLVRSFPSAITDHRFHYPAHGRTDEHVGHGMHSNFLEKVPAVTRKGSRHDLFMVLFSKPRDRILKGWKPGPGIGSHVTLPGTASMSVAKVSWGFQA